MEMEPYQRERALRVEPVEIEFQAAILNLYLETYPRNFPHIETRLGMFVNTIVVSCPELLAVRPRLRDIVSDTIETIVPDELRPRKALFKARGREFLELIKSRRDYVMSEAERKEKTILQTQVFKEDLMKVAWSPKRLEAWIAAGYDPDD